MGIALGALQFLMEESALRPWSGDVLTLGRQSSSVSAGDFVRVARACGASFLMEKVARADGNLSDNEIFTGLGFSHVSALDANAYEKPDILFDLNNGELPDGLSARFDLVFDGGTLEHVFDIATALRSICRMTKPGGRVVHISPLSNCVDHGFYSFSPTLFADFYSANRWIVHRLAIAKFKQDPSTDAWEVRDYRDHEFVYLGVLPEGAYFVLVCVQSTSDSTSGVVPQQSYYKKVWEAQ